MVTSRKYKTRPKNAKKCKCGHDHYEWTGTNIHGEEIEGYERIIECVQCDCEYFEVKK